VQPDQGKRSLGYRCNWRRPSAEELLDQQANVAIADAADGLAEAATSGAGARASADVSFDSRVIAAGSGFLQPVSYPALSAK
jgi:hypothetical protein